MLPALFRALPISKLATDGPLAPGVYLVRLSRDSDVRTSRMVVVDR